MNWRSTAAAGLAQTLAPQFPDTAVIAVAAADEDGYAVKLTDSCPLEGRFEIGSITKTMTGMVLACLASQGTVALDDKIGRWLDAGHNSDITMLQLATHTSGLPRLAPGHKSGAPDPYAFLTRKVAERELRRCERQPRGVEWDYSNFGFQVLGLAMEGAAGTEFSSLLEKYVFRPLEMSCSGVTGRGGGKRVQGHAQGKPVSPWTHHLWGAGGVEASAEDIARYLSACLTPPDSDAGQAIRIAQQPWHSINTMRSAGLGWAIGPPGYLGHDGGTSGFRAMLGLRRPARRAMAVVVNDRTAGGLATAVRRSLDREPG